ncbi:hypothetical protein HanPSC8_Chr15g0648851 [Helianthus annuus]|nr:hypothetical protein HanPSC8_Chr15g0648851 [Helianthus annuus]
MMYIYVCDEIMADHLVGLGDISVSVLQTLCFFLQSTINSRIHLRICIKDIQLRLWFGF